MRRLLAVLFAAALIVTCLAVGGFAQEQKAPTAKPAAQTEAAQEDRWHGSIVKFDAAKKTMDLRRAGGNITRVIVYSDSTKWQDMGKSIAMPTLKEGMDLIVLGKFGKDSRLEARLIDVRR